MKILCSYLLIFLFLVSCSLPKNPRIEFLKKVQKGVITGKISCKSALWQSYYLYLPTKYDGINELPVIYAFDPQGDGRLPVELLKNSAENLGYILVGSNNSRNGLSSDEIQSIVTIMIFDVRQKIAVDKHRMYMTGFSGGARIACAMAQNLGTINGVIACSAGFQPGNQLPNYYFIGIAGIQDMNYLEMKNLDGFLENKNVSHQFMVHPGKHEWPSSQTLSEALTLLEFNAMKDKIITLDQALIDKYFTDNLKEVENLRKVNQSDSLAKAYLILNRTLTILDGLTDISKLKFLLEEVNKNPILQNYLKQQQALENEELRKQQEFARAFESQSMKWWNAEIIKLNKLKISSSESLRRDMAIRLMGYISLYCYSYVNRALQYQNWQVAQQYTSIYLSVDPENPDAWYALGCLQANTGKLGETTNSLKKAIQFGFSDKNKLSNDPLLRNVPGKDELEGMMQK